MTERLLRNFVGGEYVDSAGGATSEVVYPATGEAYARAPEHADVVTGEGRIGERDRAMRMSRRLDFGAVWIKINIPFVSEMPHGGFGHSGHGKDLSMYGFEEYTRFKHVMSYFGEIASRTGKLSGK